MFAWQKVGDRRLDSGSGFQQLRFVPEGLPTTSDCFRVLEWTRKTKTQQSSVEHHYPKLYGIDNQYPRRDACSAVSQPIVVKAVSKQVAETLKQINSKSRLSNLQHTLQIKLMGEQ